MHLMEHRGWRRKVDERVARPEDAMALRACFFVLALCAPAMALAGQTSSGNTPGTDAPVHANSPSAILRPSLEILETAVGEMTLDKWKASPAIRTEADGNLRSIQRDLASTLPPLLAAADAAPDSTAKTLPIYRNIDALYDVMLRLDAAGRLAAPSNQISALDQALASIGDARRALGDQVQANAEGQEARVIHLQAALKAVPLPAPPPAPVACIPPPPKKKVARPAAKPAAKPASPPANSPNSSTPSH
jgi:hypothetical protein